MRIYKIVGIVLSAILLLASCTNSVLEEKESKDSLCQLVEGIAMSHLAKVVLEEHGYEVELQNADLAPIFVSMSGKKSDVLSGCLVTNNDERLYGSVWRQHRIFG